MDQLGISQKLQKVFLRKKIVKIYLFIKCSLLIFLTNFILSIAWCNCSCRKLSSSEHQRHPRHLASGKRTNFFDWQNGECVYILGWVDFYEIVILNRSTPGIYSFLCRSTKNGRKKLFQVNIALRKGHDISVKKCVFFSEPILVIHQKTQNFT
jgi:hypothetical protein